MHRPPTAETELAEELAVVRPALGPRFAAALPGARSAVLTRLWRGLAHEPLPWIAGRAQADREPGGGAGEEGDRGELLLRLRDGRRLHGPRSDPYASADRVTRVWLERTAYDDPARLMAALAVPHGADFAAELGHSVASMALSRAGQDPLDTPLDTPSSDPRRWPARDWEWERRVVDGHPFHPNCRSRPDFSVAEQLAYGPEHGPAVRLGLLPVPADECLVSGDWPEHLRDGTRLLIPVHPWQAAHVLKRTCAQGVTARPLMSLRTLALPGGPHVKTALSTRLTSSVRDISVGSVAASAALSDFGQSLTPHTDGLLHLTRSLGAATARSPDLAAVLRESPDVYAAPGEHVVPVAALAVTGLPRSPLWLARFARLALGVGLRLLELGVALEAHGQNLLVVLSATGAPVRLVYRDLADIRVSPARLARHGVALPDGVPARIRTDDETALRRKLFGSLVAGALAGTAGDGPALGAALAAAVRDLPRTPDLAALCGEPLPAKALTLMRLSPGAPGDRWALLPNPLRGDGN
ncbi:IucA/IucC family siderophore biosynthesis protein [Streptomyces hilarionis]|uniref:IucA/IucC family siderophore biosynthesis protein n=1 Tax=Streptomyces hilarionis TaxID=2839954 RepID=UPI00211A04C7|nr:IucA/IucC family siderophore biosynthesis protein [Streptomyces hilarionis]MCQ9135486.1 IucA/IucC family siderophore biosynthesis protein [Streptomyces hilarionis]